MVAGAIIDYALRGLPTGDNESSDSDAVIDVVERVRAIVCATAGVSACERAGALLPAVVVIALIANIIMMLMLPYADIARVYFDAYFAAERHDAIHALLRRRYGARLSPLPQPLMPLLL